MSELISGKGALIALANGERLQYRFPDSIWMDFTNNLNSSGSNLKVVDLLNDYAAFRLKPRTIKLNGIEVPAPFEPKHGDIFWYLDLTQICSYNYRQEWSDSDEYTQLGVWRTEEEIKQVVAALRSIFNEKTKEGDPS